MILTENQTYFLSRYNQTAVRVVNSYLKMGRPATCRAFVLLSEVYKCGLRTEFIDRLSSLTTKRILEGEQKYLKDNFLDVGCVFPLKSSVMSKFLAHPLSHFSLFSAYICFLIKCSNIFLKLISAGNAASFLKMYL